MDATRDVGSVSRAESAAAESVAAAVAPRGFAGIAALASGPIGPRQAIALQRAIGNAATMRVLARRPKGSGGASAVGLSNADKAPVARILVFDEWFFRGFADGKVPEPDPAKLVDALGPGFPLELALALRRGGATELSDRLERVQTQRASVDDDSEEATALDDRIRTLKWMLPFIKRVITEALKRLTAQQRTTVIWVCSHSVSVDDDDAHLIAEAFETAPVDQAGELTDYLFVNERSQLRRLERVLSGDNLEKFYLAIAPVIVKSKVNADALPDLDAVPVLPWSGKPGFRGTHYAYEVSRNSDDSKLTIKWWLSVNSLPTPWGATNVLAPDDIVAVHFERDDPEADGKQGQYLYLPAIAFLAFHNRRFWESIELGAQAAFVVGGAWGVVGAAGWVSRIVGVIEVALNAAGVVINEFRSEIDKTEDGRRFLKRWDFVQRLMFYYGLARLVVAMPKVLRSLASVYRGVRPAIKTVERAAEFDRRMGEINKALNEAERETAAAKAAEQEAAAAKGSGRAPGETPTPGETPAPAARPATSSTKPEPAAPVEEPPPRSSSAAGVAADPRVVQARKSLEDAAKGAEEAEHRAAQARERVARAQEAADTATEDLRLARERAAQARKASGEAAAAYENATRAGAARRGPRSAATAARNAADAAQGELGNAERRAKSAANELAEANDKKTWREDLAKTASEKVERWKAALARAEKAVAEGEIPRLRPDDAFSPDKRRPEFKGKGPSLPTARGRPGQIAQGAHVRISKDPLTAAAHQKRLEEIIELSRTNPQQAGNKFAQLVGEEQGWGQVSERFRAQHGRIGRRWDFGDAKEITIEGRTGAMSSDKLDQLWFDLNERGRIDLTVPSLSPEAERQLGRLGGEWQRWTGKTPTILVREVAP